MTTPLPELLAPYEKDKPKWWPEGLIWDAAHEQFAVGAFLVSDAHVESLVFGAVYPHICGHCWVEKVANDAWGITKIDRGGVYPELFVASLHHTMLEAALAAWREVGAGAG